MSEYSELSDKELREKLRNCQLAYRAIRSSEGRDNFSEASALIAGMILNIRTELHNRKALGWPN